MYITDDAKTYRYRRHNKTVTPKTYSSISTIRPKFPTSKSIRSCHFSFSDVLCDKLLHFNRDNPEPPIQGFMHWLSARYKLFLQFTILSRKIYAFVTPVSSKQTAASSQLTILILKFHSVQSSSPGLSWCWVQALQDHETVIKVIHAVVAETEKKFQKSPECRKRERGGDTGR